MGSTEEETMLQMLSQVAQIEHHQMEISIELTRLMLEYSADSKRKEEDILSAFKKAKQTVSSCCFTRGISKDIILRNNCLAIDRRFNHSWNLR